VETLEGWSWQKAVSKTSLVIALARKRHGLQQSCGFGTVLTSMSAKRQARIGGGISTYSFIRPNHALEVHPALNAPTRTVIAAKFASLSPESPFRAQIVLTQIACSRQRAHQAPLPPAQTSKPLLATSISPVLLSIILNSRNNLLSHEKPSIIMPLIHRE
jgi:hypothetical protein